jgi:hypothetical protein
MAGRWWAIFRLKICRQEVASDGILTLELPAR